MGQESCLMVLCSKIELIAQGNYSASMRWNIYAKILYHDINGSSDASSGPPQAHMANR